MKSIVFLVLVVFSAPAFAVDGIAVEAGSGKHGDMARLGVQWDWSSRWLQGNEWHVGGYWDLAIGHWRERAQPGQVGSLTEVGLTPVFRLQQNNLQGPYFEAAIGFHLLSKTSLANRRFSTSFQFGDHVGVGVRFGARGAYDLSLRFQHLSNAGIKHPNSGISFGQLRLAYHF